MFVILLMSVKHELKYMFSTFGLILYSYSINVTKKSWMLLYFQESRNCKKELNYADHQEKVIVPVMAEGAFKATGWLGVITAGALWIDFRWVCYILKIGILPYFLSIVAGHSFHEVKNDRFLFIYFFL